MNAELLLSIVGIALSIGLEYIPGLADWYGGLGPDKKRLIQLSLLVAAAGACFGLNCVGLIKLGDLVCGWPGVIECLKALLIAIGVNQLTHGVFKKRR